MSGEEFRALRKAAGVSQGAVAERANLDVSMVCLYERGKRPLPPERAAELVAIVQEVVHDRQVAAAKRAVQGARVSLGAALTALDGMRTGEPGGEAA